MLASPVHSPAQARVAAQLKASEEHKARGNDFYRQGSLPGNKRGAAQIGEALACRWPELWTCQEP